MKPLKVCHLTSAHPRYDTRIFIKQCQSLANNGMDVHLVVADNLGDEVKEKVKIIDVGAIEGRVNRILKTTKLVYNKALELDCDIYQLHDPELLPIGLKLKRKGKKVIFDSHEDVPKQFLSKPYLNPFLRKVIAFLILSYEKYVCSRLDYIITATPYIKNKFLKINKNSLDVNNFPIIGELSNNIDWKDKEDEVCYVGTIEKIRGIKEMVKAMEFTENVKFNLGGKFITDEYDVYQEVKSYKGWEKVNELGFAKREQVAEVLKKSKAGLVTLHPIINYIDALPVKMFEYMAAGIPVITSNIPLWKSIIETNQCGIAVNPMNPEEIGNAINYIMEHPNKAKEMGENGRSAVLSTYNWLNEEAKLISIYTSL